MIRHSIYQLEMGQGIQNTGQILWIMKIYQSSRWMLQIPNLYFNKSWHNQNSNEATYNNI